jgi:hypothetical protein
MVPEIVVRHGDLLLVRVSEIPKDAVQAKDPRVLAYGEVTGHAHRASAGLVFERPGGERYFRAPAGKPVVLRHDEHHAVVVPAGEFRIVYQREATEAGERQVID